MIRSIEEYTELLFGCDFFDEAFDPEGHEDHLAASRELFDRYDRHDICRVWMQYLYTECAEAKSVINFANLFVYYGASDLPVPDPVEFVSYLYYRVDMETYWDAAGDLFDTIAVNVFSKAGLIDLMRDPYYSPLKDDRIKAGIRQWSAAD